MNTYAKMREALLEITRQIEPIVKYMHPNKAEHIGLTTVFAACEPIYEIAKAALSSPPRNCDRFQTWDEAEEEYNRLVAAGKVEDGTWCDWLFAPAESEVAK